MVSHVELLNIWSSGDFFSKNMQYFTTGSINGVRNNTTSAVRAAYAMSDLDEENDKIARSLMPATLYLAVLIAIGVVGNMLVLYVFIFRLRSSTQHFFIVCLAVFDLVCCTVAMPAEIGDITLFYKFESQVACKILRLIIAFSTIASSLTLVAIAIDRFRKVCKPTETQVSLSMARLSLIPVLGGAFLFSWPTPVLYGVSTVDSGIPGFPGKDCTFSDDFKDTRLPAIYNSALFFGFGVEVLVMILLYSFILRDLKRHSRFLERWKEKENPISRATIRHSRNVQDILMAGPKGVATNLKVSNDKGRSGVKIDADINFCQDMITIEKDDRIDSTKNPSPETDTRGEVILCSLHYIDPDTPVGVLHGDVTAGSLNNNNNVSFPLRLPSAHPDDGGFSRPHCPSDGDVALCSDFSLRSNPDISKPRTGGEISLNVMSTKPCDNKALPTGSSTRSAPQTTTSLTSYTTSNLKKLIQKAAAESEDDKHRETKKVTQATCVNTSPRNISTKTTLIAFWITLVFILSYLPHLSLQVVKLVHTIDDRRGSLLVFNNIIVRSFFINSVANPFIYGLLNVKFRGEVKIILKRLACRK